MFYGYLVETSLETQKFGIYDSTKKKSIKVSILQISFMVKFNGMILIWISDNLNWWQKLIYTVKRVLGNSNFEVWTKFGGKKGQYFK